MVINLGISYRRIVDEMDTRSPGKAIDLADVVSKNLGKMDRIVITLVPT